SGLTRDQVDIWAIHPGGRAILDKTAATLGLDQKEFAPSYEVLRRYGNMSSSTIMFVLREILADDRAGHIFATAFGPGLTMEAAHLHKATHSDTAAHPASTATHSVTPPPS
ncbi:MAG: hypothetical protein PF508_08095, partial [Spirochaeta sp.]|nr:hypothetical protein [Spirochaeta sp.]